MIRRASVFVSVFVLAAATAIGTACGGSDGSDLGSTTNAEGGVFGTTDSGPQKEPCTTGLCLQQKSCPTGQTTSLSGTIFDPAGKVPLYNVTVFVPNAALAPLPSGASCERCGDISGEPIASAITDAAGHFRVTNVPVGANIPLVIQVGKWRRQITIPNVPECVDTPLTDIGQTRLPKNKAEGDIPRIALTTGGADKLECLLLKIGVDEAEFTVGGGAGRVHFYAGSPKSNLTTSAFDAAHGGQAFGSAQPFWSDVNNLKVYDIVLLSCEGQTFPATKPQAALDALYDYTNMGGRVFASHWHRFWFNAADEALHPAQGQKSKYADLGVWEDVLNFPQSINATVDTSFPKGAAMQEWLGNVNALQSGKLPITEAKKNLTSTNPANAQQWITYDPPQTVEYMSFNLPEGVPDDKKCGRVVYSDLHVASNDEAGPAWPTGCKGADLTPQEKALEFMLFDLSSCIQNDTQPPMPPPIVR